jgi:hypothetical protein
VTARPVPEGELIGVELFGVGHGVSSSSGRKLELRLRAKFEHHGA